VGQLGRCNREQGISRTKLKLCLWTLALVAIGQTVFFYYEFSSIGFPDGHLTELDRIRKIAYPLFSSWFFLFGLISGFVGMRPAKSASGRTIVVFVLVLFAINASVYSIDRFCASKFENGTGG